MKKRYIIISVAIMIALPFALNEVMKWESFRDFVGKDTDWLSFWGGYLGALVSAIVAFVILWITYNQNNKENRLNRVLQLKAIEYQQQKEWINEMSDACIDYSMALNYEDIFDLSSDIITYPERVHEVVRKCIERLIRADTKVGYLFPIVKNDAIIEFEKSRQKYFYLYNSLLTDIDKLHYLIYPVNDLSVDKLRGIAVERSELSYYLRRHIIYSIQNGCLDNDFNINFYKIIKDFFLEHKNIFNDFREAARIYVKAEEERINKILTDNI